MNEVRGQTPEGSFVRLFGMLEPEELILWLAAPPVRG